MHSYSDVLGDEGRKLLESCVKVKIYGRPDNLKKYGFKKALDRLDRCYADWQLDVECGGLPRWLPYFHMRYSMLRTQFDEYGIPNREKRYNIIDIHKGLVTFDERLYVEKYPNPGPRYDELKELIDNRRADVERECKQVADNLDKQYQYSWIVAQRRVKGCFAGSFAGDVGLLEPEPEHSPNEPYSIIEIHDAVVHWDETSVFGTPTFRGHDHRDNGWWKKSNAQLRDDVEKELNEAKLCSNDEILKEYSQVPPSVGVLPIKRDSSLDERKLQKHSKGEGPGCDELNESVDEHRRRIAMEYQEAIRGLPRYSEREVETRVQNCFGIVASGCRPSCSESLGQEPDSNQIYDIFDIHKMLLRYDQRENHTTVKFLKDFSLRISKPTEKEKNVLVLAERGAISKKYQQAKRQLHKYSRNEAERLVRDCFAGTHPYDTDIFPTKEEKNGIPKTQQTYDIFEIKNAIDHFDGKKFRERRLAGEDCDSKDRNKKAVDERAEIEEEYAKATERVEIEHGSGFIIHDHLIITKRHIIRDALKRTEEDKSELHSEVEQDVNVMNDITIKTDDVKEICIANAVIGELPCEVIQDDPCKDLALLYCRELNLRENEICPLQLSNHSLLPGMEIVSFGYPASHKGERALIVNGRVSGSKETYNKLCSLYHAMAVLDCPLNHGHSGGPVLCWVKNQLKVVGMAKEKHINDILTLEEGEKIEKIRDSLRTSAIPSVSDEAIKCASAERERSNDFSPRPDPCQTPMFLLTLKLYDALETHCQFNLSNAVPGHCMIEFVEEALGKCKEEAREELAEVVQWSKDHVNVLPSGNHSASECCTQ